MGALCCFYDNVQRSVGAGCALRMPNCPHRPAQSLLAPVLTHVAVEDYLFGKKGDIGLGVAARCGIVRPNHNIEDVEPINGAQHQRSTFWGDEANAQSDVGLSGEKCDW